MFNMDDFSDVEEDGIDKLDCSHSADLLKIMELRHALRKAEEEHERSRRDSDHLSGGRESQVGKRSEYNSLQGSNKTICQQSAGDKSEQDSLQSSKRTLPDSYEKLQPITESSVETELSEKKKRSPERGNSKYSAQDEAHQEAIDAIKELKFKQELESGGNVPRSVSLGGDNAANELKLQNEPLLGDPGSMLTTSGGPLSMYGVDKIVPEDKLKEVYKRVPKYSSKN